MGESCWRTTLLWFALAGIMVFWTLTITRLNAANQSLSIEVAGSARAHGHSDGLDGLVDLLPNLVNLTFDLPCNAYYLNLDTSLWRRRIMDRTFGQLWRGKLHRLAAVNGQNESLLEDLTADPKLAARVRHGHLVSGTKGLNELGAILSHLYAVKEAFNNGDNVALILEDDVGPYLMPYWTLSIGDVVNMMNEESPNAWDSVQLAWWPMRDPDHMAGWLDEMSRTPLVRGYFLKAHWHWSTAAYLISRRGMQKVLDTFFTGRHVSAHVVPAVGEGLGIDAEVYYKDLFTDNYLMVPSMFITHGKDSTVEVDDGVVRPLQVLTQYAAFLSVRALRDKYFTFLKDNTGKQITS